MQVAIFLVSDERLLILPVIGVAAGVYWFYKGFRLLQRKRLILNTPASKIRSASMGLVEVSGLATGPYVLTSPLKQTECYYHRSIAWELQQRGKNSEWVKVAEETLHVPFYVDDDTDKVLVDPRGADMDLHCDLHEQYNRSVLFSGPEMPGCVSEFLLRHAANPNKRIKVEEYCIKPKNFLFVLGTLSQNPGLDASVMPSWAERSDQRSDEGTGFSSASLRTSLAPAPEMGEDARRSTGVDGEPQIIRLSPETSMVRATEMTQQQKIAAALTKAGISSPAAWAAAGFGGKLHSAVAVQPASAAGEKRNSADATGFDLHPPVVLMKGSHDPAFFISWRSQREVVKSLGWKSNLMIWGGPALTVVCVYFLLAHFGWL
jgi:E3 ubiquitin ligase